MIDFKIYTIFYQLNFLKKAYGNLAKNNCWINKIKIKNEC